MSRQAVYLGIGLAIGLIIAAGVYAALLQQLSDSQSRLAECEAQVGRLTSEKSMLVGELEGCRGELAESRSRISVLVDRLAAANETIRELRIELLTLRAEASRLREELASLRDRFESLRASYDSLLAQYQQAKMDYEKLVKEYSGLRREYESVLASYQYLMNKYREVSGEYEKLREDYEELSRDYERLREELGQLEEDYRALKRSYESLMDEYDRLRDAYDRLVRDYDSLVQEHEKLVSAVEEVSLWLGYAYENKTWTIMFYNKVLMDSISTVMGLVEPSMLEEPAGIRSLAVFEWILMHLGYCYDNYVRLVDPSNLTVTVIDEVLKLPNETMANGCGDCEDLALFAYALMKAVPRPGERVFIVEFYPSEGPGHAGVLVVAEEDGEKRYYVIDPAGNYFNGLGLSIRLHVIAPNGSEWYVYLDPLDLSPSEKRLLKEFSTIVYHDYFEDKTYVHGNITLWYYGDALSALRDWIIHYWGIDTLDEIVVRDIGVYEEFTSIEDAADWIEKNT